MIYWKPFKSKFSLYSAVIAETNFLVICVTMFSFTNNNDIILRCIGWGEISMILASLTCSWACTLIQQVKSYKRLVQIASKKANKVVNAEKNISEITQENINQNDHLRSQENITNNKMLRNSDEVFRKSFAQERKISGISNP